jgi:hypothetical protein
MEFGEELLAIAKANKNKKESSPQDEVSAKAEWRKLRETIIERMTIAADFLNRVDAEAWSVEHENEGVYLCFESKHRRDALSEGIFLSAGPQNVLSFSRDEQTIEIECYSSMKRVKEYLGIAKVTKLEIDWRIKEFVGMVTDYQGSQPPALISTFAPVEAMHRVFSEPRRYNWPKIFVLMPFRADLKPVYEDHICKVAKHLQLDVGRADDFFTTGSIMSDIWGAIKYADLIIADCTERNPNVFYEIGIAHAIGKDTILISQSIEDVPFDLRHMRVIQYELTPRGMPKFEEKLAKTIETLREKS